MSEEELKEQNPGLNDEVDNPEGNKPEGNNADAETMAQASNANPSAEQQADEQSASEQSASEQSAPEQLSSEQKTKKSGYLPFVLLGVAAVVIVVSLISIVRHRTVKDRYEGPKWYEGDVEMPKMPVVESFSENENGDDSIANEWVFGNDIYSYANYRDIAADEDNYYFADPSAENGIFRIEKSSSHARTKICDISGENLSVIDGKVYFINKIANPDYVQGIYRVNTDGSDREFMMEGMFSNLILINDWMYYIRKSDSAICKCNIDDRKEIVLSDQKCAEFLIDENTVYYFADDKEDDELENRKLYTMDVNGNDITEILDRARLTELAKQADKEIYNESDWPDYLKKDEGFDLNRFIIHDEDLILYSGNEGIITIPLDKVSSELSPESVVNGFEYIKGIQSAPYFIGSTMIFSKDEESDGKYLYGIKDDGSEVQIMDMKDVSTYSFFDDYIIFTWVDDSTKYTASANNLITGESAGFFFE